jgi:uncharacterized membrane protein YdfJ with MMPL/SSD domain
MIGWLMHRIDGLIAHRRRWVIGVWAALFVLAVPLSLKQTDHLVTSGAIVPGSDSAVVDAAARTFPHHDDGEQGVLLRLAPGASRQALADAVVHARRTAVGIPGIVLQRHPVDHVLTPLPATLAFVPLTLRGDQDQRVDAAVALRMKLGVGSGAHDGVTPYVVGQDGLWAALHDLQKEELKKAEAIGLPVSLLILLFVFGALGAALLPAALAAISVTLTGAVIYFLSLMLNMSVFVTNAASMVGIGVAIDYSLFVLARYRQEIAAGRDEAQARTIALRTSGSVIVFSGLTVIAALSGIFVVDSTLLRSMAVGMIVVVGISIAGAVTLTPALIDLFGQRVYGTGHRIDAVKRRFRKVAGALPGRHRPAGGPDFWTRWTRRVTRRPLFSALAATGLMLVLAIPALDMSLGEGALDQFPRSSEAVQGVTIAARSTGPGRQGPVQELITFSGGSGDSPVGRRALARHVAALRAQPGVATVDPPLRRPGDATQVVLTIVPTTAADTPASRRLLMALRADAASGRGDLAGVATVTVGGATAFPTDFMHLISRSMWKIVAFIVLLSYLILMVMLRSLLLPLKAVLMTALSVVAAYGVLVAVFQWGWLDGLTGFHAPGHVDATAPPLLLAIVFGLSMDYEVFLLSRIREAMTPGVDTPTAIARGLRSSAATISSAALIMVSVFAVFAAVGLPSIQQFGTGLAVAIFLDATIVRLVLVPATMQLMGRWNWWMPRWLDRLLPRMRHEEAPPVPVVTADVPVLVAVGRTEASE